jgi:hypothetical protein
MKLKIEVESSQYFGEYVGTKFSLVENLDVEVITENLLLSVANKVMEQIEAENHRVYIEIHHKKAVKVRGEKAHYSTRVATIWISKRRIYHVLSFENVRWYLSGKNEFLQDTLLNKLT